MTTPLQRNSRIVACGCVCLSLMFTLTACNKPPGVNPWRDDSVPPANWNTPGFEGIRAADKEPVMRQRDIAESRADHRPAVPHYPLGWEDPFESFGNGDDQFAWIWLDYVAMPYGLGRFIVNTIAFPVSVAVYPPGTSMISDGNIAEGEEFDAVRGKSPDPTGERSDFGEHGSQAPPFEILESEAAH